MTASGIGSEALSSVLEEDDHEEGGTSAFLSAQSGFGPQGNGLQPADVAAQQRAENQRIKKTNYVEMALSKDSTLIIVTLIPRSEK
jgi:hypothetical protein